LKFENKNILITGASSGIGYELAKQFAGVKCNLILVARRKEILDSLAHQIRTDKTTILTYKCDIRNKSEVKDLFSNIRKKVDHIDIAILNSGVGLKSSVENFNSELADETFQVNVLGMIYCIEELLKDFLPRKSGMIVGVSSIADVRGFPTNGFYCASKAAISAFLESIRVELKRHNVKVVNVRPGFVTTPMTSKNKFKMPFLMDAERAARIILNGIKKEKKVIEFPHGTVLGGKLLKILPNFIFDYLTAKGLPKLKSEL
jgi:short-subunit dehydrogenase